MLVAKALVDVGETQKTPRLDSHWCRTEGCSLAWYTVLQVYTTRLSSKLVAELGQAYEAITPALAKSKSNLSSLLNPH